MHGMHGMHDTVTKSYAIMNEINLNSIVIHLSGTTKSTDNAAKTLANAIKSDTSLTAIPST